VFNHILPKDEPTSKKDENNEHVQQKCQSSKFSGPDNIKEFKNKSKNTHKNLKSTKDSGLFTQSEFNPQLSSDNNIAKGIFANLEFSKVKPEQKPFLDFEISIDSPILKQFEHLLEEQ